MANSDMKRFGPWQWPVEGQRDSRQQSRVVRLRGHLVVLLLMVLLPLTTLHVRELGSGIRWALLIVDLVFYAVSFLVFTDVGQRRSRSTRILMVAWLLVVGSVVPVITGDVTAIVNLAYAIVAAVILLPAQASRLIGVGVAVAQLIATRVVDGKSDWSGTWLLLLLTLSMSSLFKLTRAVSQLEAARSVIAHQSVVEERNRLARDLHDVLGHTVATIALKGGVARRMLEREVDRETLRTEVQQIEELARTAMEEIRSTVLDTRSASLEAELAGVGQALHAAGVSASLPEAADPVRADLRDVFAHVLREGVTNVIKHSGARNCEVRFGETWLEIQDDGHTKLGGVDTRKPIGSGYGLLGLGERLRVVGGRLETSRARSGGFLLRAEVGARQEG